MIEITPAHAHALALMDEYPAIGCIVPIEGRPGRVYVSAYFSPLFLEFPAEVACVAAAVQAHADARTAVARETE